MTLLRVDVNKVLNYAEVCCFEGGCVALEKPKVLLGTLTLSIIFAGMCTIVRTGGVFDVEQEALLDQLLLLLLDSRGH